MSTDPKPADQPVTFTAEEWLTLRRKLGTVPFTGAMQISSCAVDGPERLFQWLDLVTERLNYVSDQNDEREAQLAEARRIIDGGRVWHAAMAQPAGTPLRGKPRGKAQS